MKEYISGDIIQKRYRIIGELGKGGMASVYRAYDEIAETEVAIKSISIEVVKKPEGQERFELERDAFAKLGQNPNVVRLHDVIQEGEQWLIVLEIVEGGTLKDRLNDFGSMTLTEIKYYFSHICDALEEAHSLKIIHRDIKPDNVMLTNSGEVKLGDFGISVIQGKSSEEKKAIGTPKYMPPEVIRASAPTPESDIYSLGIMLYEFSTGVAPFVGKNANEIAAKHVKEVPISPRIINPLIPIGLENLIMKMIEKDPINRFSNASQVKENLLKINDKDNIKPYKYHKSISFYSNDKLKINKIGNSIDNLPFIHRTKFVITIFLIFIFFMMILVGIFIWQNI